MNYYSFHVGDYLTRTAHLTPMEDIVYRRLIDLYYLSEKPLPGDAAKCARLIRMQENTQEVQSVLEEFFTQDEGQWINKRCDEEIESYHAKIEQSSRAGLASAQSRKNNARTTKPRRANNTRSTSVEQTLNERSTDVQPTNNQEPITNIEIPTVSHKKVSLSLPEWLSHESFAAFEEHRKKLKAPMTALAKSRLIAELSRLREGGNEPCAVLDQSILNGWKGVFPLKNLAAQGVGKAARQQQDKEWLNELTGRNRQSRIIDITPAR